jgi:hypothetical protein
MRRKTAGLSIPVMTSVGVAAGCGSHNNAKSNSPGNSQSGSMTTTSSKSGGSNAWG